MRILLRVENSLQTHQPWRLGDLIVAYLLFVRYFELSPCGRADTGLRRLRQIVIAVSAEVSKDYRPSVASYVCGSELNTTVRWLEHTGKASFFPYSTTRQRNTLSPRIRKLGFCIELYSYPLSGTLSGKWRQFCFCQSFSFMP